MLVFKKSYLSAQAFAIGVGLFALGLLGAIHYFRIWTDIQVHHEHIEEILLGKRMFPGHFLYFLLVAASSFWQPNMYILTVTGGIWLSAAVALKFSLSRQYLEDHSQASGFHPIELHIAVFFLLIAFSLPADGSLMLGQFPLNVWHNSTMIFVMPAVILLFLRSWEYLRAPNRKMIPGLTLWITLNLLIKPSFMIGFLPVFGIILFLRHPFKQAFLQGLLPVTIGFLILLVQYIYIFEMAELTAPEVRGGIAIKPFYSWSLKSNCLGWSLIASIAFPLCVLIFYWQESRRNGLFVYAWILLAMALLLMILLAETGSRAFHGNFNWQVLITNYLVFLVALGIFLPKTKHPWNWKTWTAGYIFSLHVISGLIYLVHMFMEKTSLL